MIKRATTVLTIAGLTVLLCTLGSTSARAEPPQFSTTNVYWSYDPVNPIGTATLIRTQTGITAVLDTLDIPAGQAVTLWLIFFNNPEHCDSDPCADVSVAPDEFLADLFNPDVAGDFYFGGGHVTNQSGRAIFAGQLRVGDDAGSGRVEVGVSPAVPLADPFKAEVLLALHSHGPATRGPGLRHQINSFLGGCTAFLGPNGFAASPADVPDAEGECSTMQFSLHEGGGQ